MKFGCIKDAKIESVYKRIKREKENIVLIGMPSSGKSTAGTIIARKLNREFIDTDNMIAEKAGMSIPDIFKTLGEAKFRELECEAVRCVSAKTGAVIATGGGVPLNKDNISALKENGRIYFIDRPLKKLIPTDDRPLSSTKEAITERYGERYGIYNASADINIDADCDIEVLADKIIGEFES